MTFALSINWADLEMEQDQFVIIYRAKRDNILSFSTALQIQQSPLAGQCQYTVISEINYPALILSDQKGLIADRLDSEMLRGFCDRQTDRRTFAIVESLLRLKICNLEIVYFSVNLNQLVEILTILFPRARISIHDHVLQNPRKLVCNPEIFWIDYLVFCISLFSFPTFISIRTQHKLQGNLQKHILFPNSQHLKDFVNQMFKTLFSHQ